MPLKKKLKKTKNKIKNTKPIFKALAIIFAIIIVFKVFSSDDRNPNWMGTVYPDYQNGFDYTHIGFSYYSLEDCRTAAINFINEMNYSNAGYECGLGCKFENGIYICKETAR